jgi:low affinity Fe/Cu permease
MILRDLFRRVAHWTAHVVGTSGAFLVALAVIGVWLISGPFFHYSDTWQLFINTGTTIVTFLMVFLIQNSQNRDSHALHLKLDELISANEKARNRLLALEDLSDAELAELQLEFEQLRDRKSSPARAPGSGARPSVQVKQRAAVADREDLSGSVSPDAVEIGRRAARHRAPGATRRS